MRRWAAGVWAVVLAGCGPEAAVWLRVEAPLVVPRDCDALQVEVRRGGAEGEVAFAETFSLAQGPQFPLTLTLTEAQLGEERQLWVSASALSQGVLARPWSSRAATVVLEPREVTPLVLPLCDCS